ncbi:DNA-binding MarR family transcriptional regulator [Paenibacillus forsythiae]|uniref:DNA-binding MarR family transcriptional regulator n=1 Tax=Paenibacillus forsythiae TaxID=365616 RepID=A0ABU3HC90_9BACL|nr:MarR family transcriptional regulator [Paenibacillus forsythiae]MDT3427305.1 DNA-binding MarR family transcriptional regulator [Paenibacillus forsythiae]
MDILDLLAEMTELITKSMREHKSKALGLQEFQRLTLVQFYYIEAIQRMDHPTFSDLADRFSVSKPSVTNIIYKLIAEGFVVKSQSMEDKRRFHLQLTPKGDSLMAAERQAYKELTDGIADRLTKEEVSYLKEMLMKILRSTEV